jgi:hypothetical protein
MKELLPSDNISSSECRIRNSRDQQRMMMKVSFYIPVCPQMSRKVLARICFARSPANVRERVESVMREDWLTITSTPPARPSTPSLTAKEGSRIGRREVVDLREGAWGQGRTRGSPLHHDTYDFSCKSS